MDDPKNFREVGETLRVEDPNFGKVDNSDPSAKFAFEVRNRPAVFDVAEMTLEEASSELFGYDDYGKIVDAIPLRETAFEGSFGFDAYGFDFADECEDSISPAEFVWRLSQHIAKDVFVNPKNYELDFDPEDLWDLLFHRFYFSSSDEYWDIVFDYKSEQSGSDGSTAAPRI